VAVATTAAVHIAVEEAMRAAVAVRATVEAALTAADEHIKTGI